MQKVLAAFAAVGIASALTGCGTVVNLEGIGKTNSKYVYGGVRVDACAEAALLRDATVGNPEAPPDYKENHAELLALAAFAAVDMPLSAIADTLTLPVTIPASWRCGEKRKKLGCSPSDLMEGAIYLKAKEEPSEASGTD
jgi:uncharacterized protein YceK